MPTDAALEPAPSIQQYSPMNKRINGGRDGGRGTYRRRPLSVAKCKAAVGSPAIPATTFTFN